MRIQRNFAAELNAKFAEIPEGTPLELWFQDEARICQKNGIVHQ
jgi:hypothetical protein